MGAMGRVGARFRPAPTRGPPAGWSLHQVGALADLAALGRTLPEDDGERIEAPAWPLIA